MARTAEVPWFKRPLVRATLTVGVGTAAALGPSVPALGSVNTAGLSTENYSAPAMGVGSSGQPTEIVQTPGYFLKHLKADLGKQITIINLGKNTLRVSNRTIPVGYDGTTVLYDVDRIVSGRLSVSEAVPTQDQQTVVNARRGEFPLLEIGDLVGSAAHPYFVVHQVGNASLQPAGSERLGTGGVLAQAGSDPTENGNGLPPRTKFVPAA